MHSLLIVVGDDLPARLHRFSDHTKVAPYRVYVDGKQLEAMAEQFALPPENLEALARRMPEWNGCEATVHQGKLSYFIRDNPDGKFDWYRVGGRFRGYLRLAEPRKPSLVGRLLRKPPVDRVDRARKGEVQVEHVVANPPFAILAGDSWVEQGWSKDAPTDEQWKQQFAARFALLADHELLTVVDIHS